MEFIELQFKHMLSSSKLTAFFSTFILISTRECLFNSLASPLYHNFQSGTQCFPCLPSCLNCYSEKDESCLNGNCELGFYYAPNENKCLRCMDLCERCQASEVGGSVKLSCIQCFEGYYYNEINQQCLECLTGASQCTYSSSLLCFDGFYFDQNSLTCKSCSSNCKICDQRDSCLQCSPTFLVSFNTLKCITCPILNCQQCSYITETTFTCSSCIIGYKLYSNSLCMKYSCNPLHCLQCSQSADLCTLCESQYYQIDGKCFYGSSLMCKYAEKGVDYGRCLSCIEGISKNVESSSGYCVPDFTGEGFSQWNNYDGFTTQFNVINEQLFCYEPYSRGSTFSDEIRIDLSFRPSYLMMVSVLILIQDIDHNSSNNLIQLSLNIDSTQIPVSNSLPVIEEWYCKTYGQSLTNVKVGRIIKKFRIGAPEYQPKIPYSEGSQQQQISLTFSSQSSEALSIQQLFVQFSLCQQDNCYRCLSANACQECTYPFLVEDYNCVLECSSGYNINTELRTCTFRCEQGFYLNQLQNSCISCRQQCTSCSSEEVCRKCANGYYLNSDSMCRSSCLSTFQYPSIFSGKCEKCPNPCLTCQNNTEEQIDCLSCLSGYYLNLSCLAQCPSGYYSTVTDSLPICQLCQFPCSTCQFQAKICLSCQFPYYILKGDDGLHQLSGEMFEYGQIPLASNNSFIYNSTYLQLSSPACLQFCPKGYFMHESTMNCQKCRNPCFQCEGDSKNCKKCKFGFLVHLIDEQNKQRGNCLNQCPEGYYLNATIKECIKCSDFNCASCQATQSNDFCQQCQNGFYLENGQCVSVCTNGWAELDVCQKCIYPCIKCSSEDRCDECSSDYYLDSSNFSCVLRCPVSFYDSDPIQQISKIATCESCRDECESCLTFQKCLSCNIGYTFQQSTFSCILNSQCPLGHFLTNDSCQICSSQCLECATTDSFCLSCSDSNKYLHQEIGKCLETCPQNYLNNDYNSTCTACDEQCLTCLGTSENCTSCKISSYLYLEEQFGQCLSLEVCQNKFGYFPYLLTSSCRKCSSPCRDCSSIFLCNLCEQNYYLFDGKCLQNCEIGFYKENTALVETQYYQENMQYLGNISGLEEMSYLTCQVCHPFCQQCSLQLVCSVCQEGYYLQTFADYSILVSQFNDISINSSKVDLINFDFCLPSCPQYYYEDSLTKKCKECKYPCSQCTDLLVCLTCFEGLSYLNGQCYQSCPLGYYFNQQNSSLTCEYCSQEGCSSCENSQKCLSCHSQYLYYSTNFTCLKNCPDFYYPNIYQRKCVQCSLPCSKCANQFDCISCISVYALKDGRCYSVCPLGSYQKLNQNGDNVCQTCPSLCLQCSSYFYCQSCLPHAYLHQIEIDNEEISMCVDRCPDGFFAVYEQKICSQCSSLCETCSEQRTSCTSCFFGKYLQNKNCVLACSPGYYLQAGQYCQKCQSGCVKCNSTECFECENSYLNQKGECLSECPPGNFKNVEDFRCEQCQQGCLSCDSEQICLECSFENGYALMDITCIELPCPSSHYYYGINNQCLEICNEEAHLVYEAQKQCFDRSKGCPLQLIQRGETECVERCSIDEYIEWANEDKSEVVCRTGESKNIFKGKAVSMSGRIKILIEFSEMVSVKREWSQYFQIEVSKQEQETEIQNSRLLVQASSDKMIPVSAEIIQIGQMVTNMLVFEVKINQDSLSPFGKLYSAIFIKIILPSYIPVLSNSQNHPLQNKQLTLELYNTVLSPNEPINLSGLSTAMTLLSLGIVLAMFYSSYRHQKKIIYTASNMWEHLQIFGFAVFFNSEWGPLFGSYLRGFGIFYGWEYNYESANTVFPSQPKLHSNAVDSSLINALPSLFLFTVLMGLIGILKSLKQKQILGKKIGKILSSESLLSLAVLAFVPNIFLFSLAKILSLFSTNYKLYLAEYPSQIVQLISCSIFLIGSALLLVYILIQQQYNHQYLDPGIISQKKAIIRQLPIYYQVRKIGIIVLAVSYQQNGLYSICFGVLSTIITLTMLAWYQPFFSQLRYKLTLISEAFLLCTFILMFAVALNPEGFQIISILLLVSTIGSWISTLIYPILILMGTKEIELIQGIQSEKESVCSQKIVDTLENSPQRLVPENYQPYPKIEKSQEYVEEEVSVGRQADESSYEDSEENECSKEVSKHISMQTNQTKRLLKGLSNNYRQFKHYDIVEQDQKMSETLKNRQLNRSSGNSDQQLLQKELKLKKILFEYRKQNSSLKAKQRQSAILPLKSECQPNIV